MKASLNQCASYAMRGRVGRKCKARWGGQGYPAVQRAVIGLLIVNLLLKPEVQDFQQGGLAWSRMTRQDGGGL